VLVLKALWANAPWSSTPRRMGESRRVEVVRGRVCVRFEPTRGQILGESYRAERDDAGALESSAWVSATG
jgi:hypothetical protein